MKSGCESGRQVECGKMMRLLWNDETPLEIDETPLMPVGEYLSERTLPTD